MSEELAHLGTPSLHAGRDLPGNFMLHCAATGRGQACRALVRHYQAGHVLRVSPGLGDLTPAEERINHKQACQLWHEHDLSLSQRAPRNGDRELVLCWIAQSGHAVYKAMLSCIIPVSMDAF